MPDLRTEAPALSWSALRELSNRSFFNFCRIVNAVPPGCYPISREIHKPLCDFYQQSGTYRKAIAMPRDWLKSTIFTKWGTIWRYLQNPECRVLIAAENERLAGRFLHWIQQQILNNKFLREMYPELNQVDPIWTRSHRWSSSECDLPRKGTYSEPSITAIGVGGAAQSGHYDFLCIDDLVGKKAKESLLVLESVLRWFDNTPELLVQPHKDMPSPSTISIHGTFWFPGDFLCYVRDKYQDFEFRVTPCRKREQESKWAHLIYVQKDDADIGESNWEQFPTEYYIQMAANPEKNIDYWAQHMNDPEQASGLTNFDTAWLRYYHIKEKDGQKYIVCDDDKEEFRLGAFPLYGFIDPGGFYDKRLTKTGSRFAVMTGGQPVGSRKKFITYAKAFKFKEPSLALDEVFVANNFYKPVTPAIWRQEVFAQQRYILMDIKKEAERRKIPMRIVDLPADERKDAKALRIDALKQPMFSGEIYVQRGMKDLISEIQVYPNGLTVDLLDTMAQMFRTYFRRNEEAREQPRPTPKQAWLSSGTTIGRTGY